MISSFLGCENIKQREGPFRVRACLIRSFLKEGAYSSNVTDSSRSLAGDKGRNLIQSNLSRKMVFTGHIMEKYMSR